MIVPVKSSARGNRKCVVLMLLSNAYDPDPRVQQEAYSLIAAGCRVRILAWDRDLKCSPSENIDGVEVSRVHLQSTHGRGTAQLLYYARVYLKMFRMGWQMDFDAVHCHDLDTLPVGFVLGAARRKAVVYDAHENFTDMLTGSVHPWIRRALRRMETCLIRRVDLLITVGEKLRRHFEERGARNSVAVGNWKRIEEFARTPEQNREVRRKLGIPDGALTVVCITQLLKDRKLTELLDAVDALPDVYAVVGGGGVMEQYVRERAANNPRIIYLGFVKPVDIPAYTCAADVVYYGFDPDNPNARYSAPNKLYEAVAAGRPLITGDFGEIGEVAREARCGIVLPAYSAESVRQALETMRDESRRMSMAANAAAYGRSAMNWDKGDAILRREYSALLPVLPDAQPCG